MKGAKTILVALTVEEINGSKVRVVIKHHFGKGIGAKICWWFEIIP